MYARHCGFLMYLGRLITVVDLLKSIFGSVNIFIHSLGISIFCIFYLLIIINIQLKP